MKTSNLIIGAGFTGLGASFSNGFKTLEKNSFAGGICSSYKKESFKFELGGGHWIFGLDNCTKNLFERFDILKSYERKAAIFFIGNLESTKDLSGLFINYPIQLNINQLGKKLENKIISEINNIKKESTSNIMSDWLLYSFGNTLNEIFFKPFHEKYTDSLYKEIITQDMYKTPNILKSEKGYNVSFYYPSNGLDFLTKKISEECDINYDSCVEKIDLEDKVVYLSNGKYLEYKKLISTLPLNILTTISSIKRFESPYTSVLVLNIGAKIGKNKISKHGYHWIYIPDSKSGFHRIGYYSNIDNSFLPQNIVNDDLASIYVEFSFRNSNKPSKEKIDTIISKTIIELKEIGFIDDVIIVDPTWIEVAYTWNNRNDNYINDTLEYLKTKDIFSIGRYGRWCFQGISESFKEGYNFNC